MVPFECEKGEHAMFNTGKEDNLSNSQPAGYKQG